MRPDLITDDMQAMDVPMLEFLANIVTHNRGRVVTKAITVPLPVLRLPCGCERDFGTPLWKVSMVDTKGAPLPVGKLNHTLAGPKVCNATFAVPLAHR